MKKYFFFFTLFLSFICYQTSFASHDLIIDTTIIKKYPANGTLVRSYLVSYNKEELAIANPYFKFNGERIKKIIVVRDDGISVLELPKPEFSRLSKLLTRGLYNLVKNPEKTAVDCFLSLSYLKNISCHYIDCEGAPFLLVDKFFSTEKKIRKDDLRPGDGLRIVQTSSSSYHCAFYLGQNLYFSKYGAKGGFVVTTLEEMKRFWGHGDPSNFLLYRIDVAETETSEKIPVNIEKVSKEDYFKKLCKKHRNPDKFWKIIKLLYPVSADFEEFIDHQLKLRAKEPSPSPSQP